MLESVLCAMEEWEFIDGVGELGLAVYSWTFLK